MNTKYANPNEVEDNASSNLDFIIKKDPKHVRMTKSHVFVPKATHVQSICVPRESDKQSNLKFYMLYFLAIFAAFYEEKPHQIPNDYICFEEQCLCDMCMKKHIYLSQYSEYTFRYRIIWKQSRGVNFKNWMFLCNKFTSHYGEKEIFSYLFRLMEDCAYFMTVATDQTKRNKADQIIFAFCIFAKMRHKGLLLEIIMREYLPFIKSIIYGADSVQSFEGGLNDVREAFEKTKYIKDSALLKKLHKCIMFMLSYSLFDKVGINMDTFGYSKMAQADAKRKYNGKTDFFMTVVDTLIFVLEKGFQVYKTQDINTIFHSSAEYQKIYDVCAELKRKEKFLANPEAGGFKECEFRAQLDDVIEKLASVCKHSSGLSRFDRETLKYKLDSMRMMHADLTMKKEGRRNRDAPFGIAIFSPPGMGKTSITQMICKFLCRIRNLPKGDEYVYTRNPVDQFWSGFVSSVHTLILDDIASENPDMKDPKSVNEIIQVMNNAAFCPNQAELEMKGRTPLRVKNVIATTNVIDFNAYSFFAVPSAVQRRFPYIVIPTVRPEFLSDRGVLDSTKVVSRAYPDFCTYTVQKVVCRKMTTKSELRSLALREDVLVNASQQEFFLWLRDTVNAFEIEQTKIKESMRSTEEACYCSRCDLPEVMCACPSSVQSRLVQIGAFVSLILCFKLWFTKIHSFYRKIKFYLGILSFSERVLLFGQISRERFSRIGSRVQRSLGQPTIYLTIAGVLASFMGVYYFSRPKPSKIQTRTEMGSRPADEVDGRENVWYKNEMPLTDIDFTRESLSSKSIDFQSFQKKIFRNVVRLEIDIPGTTMMMPCQALCLGGQRYLVNNHCVPEFEETSVKYLCSNTSTGISPNQKFVLTKKCVARYPDKDLAVLMLKFVPPKRDITQYFMKNLNGRFNGSYIVNTNGSFDVNNVKNIRFYKNHPFNIEIMGQFDTYVGHPSRETKWGECGSPLLVQSEYGYAIAGIHVATNMAMSTSFTLAIDLKTILSLKNDDVFCRVQSGAMDLISSESEKRTVTELHKKSVFRYLQDGSATLYGSFVGFRGKGKSRVEATPMSHELAKSGYKIKFFKPEMSSWEPWNIAAQKIVSKKAQINTDILDICMEGYIKDVLANLSDPKNIQMCMVLDDFTTINGANVAYVDKINRNTSAGNPWKKSKRNFMEAIPAEQGMQDPVVVSDEIMDRVVDIIDRAKNLERSHSNFCAHLKDEPVSLKKAKMKKTRVFTGAPLDYVIVVRKFCLGFIRLVQNERFAFESAPGTIAQSLEWQEIFNFITQHGEDRIVGGDFAGFDTSMVAPEIVAAFKVIYRFSEMSGNFSQEELDIIAVLAMDTAFALVDYSGDLVMFHGMNPSGNPLTVILNGIVNALRTRYTYYMLNPNKEVDTFRENVKLVTYGDDNIMGVSERVPWFNHTNIAEAYSEINIVYTMADKEAESVPYINIYDADFLKRKWLFDDNLGCHLAPLAEESIEKMLMVWTRSKSVPAEVQAMSVISSAVSEYFFYGQHVFESKVAILKKMVMDLDWQVFVEESTFPSYKELCERFKRSSKHSPIYGDYFDKE